MSYDDAGAAVVHLLPEASDDHPLDTLCLCRHRRGAHGLGSPHRCTEDGCRWCWGFKPHPRQEPCVTGFAWIGQAFDVCDYCPFPAWEHAGMAELRPDRTPFGVGDDAWQLRPWRDGEAERIRAKWEGYSG